MVPITLASVKRKEDDAMDKKSMTPSGSITAGQIGKICDLLTAALRKSGLPSEPVQQVIETQGEQLVSELVAVVRKRVEAASDLIVRRVKVDRSRNPQRVLDATGRRQYADPDVVADMPGSGNGTEEVEVHFFKLGRYVSDDELEKEYDLRGLKPADPYSLAQVNADDPAFADERPNATHWQDAGGRWCYAAFHRWDGERRVHVHRHARVWHVFWWFAGLRK